MKTFFVILFLISWGPTVFVSAQNRDHELKSCGLNGPVKSVLLLCSWVGDDDSLYQAESKIIHRTYYNFFAHFDSAGYLTDYYDLDTLNVMQSGYKCLYSDKERILYDCAIDYSHIPADSLPEVWDVSILQSDPGWYFKKTPYLVYRSYTYDENDYLVEVRTIEPDKSQHWEEFHYSKNYRVMELTKYEKDGKLDWKLMHERDKQGRLIKVKMTMEWNNFLTDEPEVHVFAHSYRYLKKGRRVEKWVGEGSHKSLSEFWNYDSTGRLIAYTEYDLGGDSFCGFGRGDETYVFTYDDISRTASEIYTFQGSSDTTYYSWPEGGKPRLSPHRLYNFREDNYLNSYSWDQGISYSFIYTNEEYGRYDYRYEYDVYGNWIVRYEYRDGILCYRTARTIAYY